MPDECLNQKEHGICCCEHTVGKHTVHSDLERLITARNLSEKTALVGFATSFIYWSLLPGSQQEWKKFSDELCILVMASTKCTEEAMPSHK